MLARRDVPGRDGKSFVPVEGLADAVSDTLTDIQTNLLARATEFRDANTSESSDYESLREAATQGFARAWWCGDAACEDKVKDDIKATTRCIPSDQPGGSGACIVCGKPAEEITIFARAY